MFGKDRDFGSMLRVFHVIVENLEKRGNWASCQNGTIKKYEILRCIIDDE